MKKLNMDYWRAVFEELIRREKPNDAWRLTMDKALDFHQLQYGWKDSLQEHANASFTCSQCFRHWSSHRVFILFHLHWKPYTRQGRVQMRFCGQQCLVCHSKYEEPEFTEEAVMKVVNQLIRSIRKKCYGEPIHDTELVEVDTHRTGPHKLEYCEAYHLGIHRSGGHHATAPSWRYESIEIPETTEEPGTPAPSSIRPDESCCPFVCAIL
ncbi:receptor-transporting protein 4-like [Anolis sagrei]|uniref:receptor-transporting protein 4-like n=1 Tax=Anolis sagrei TaxID=38937 RepID=UPI00352072ED